MVFTPAIFFERTLRMQRIRRSVPPCRRAAYQVCCKGATSASCFTRLPLVSRICCCLVGRSAPQRMCWSLAPSALRSRPPLVHADSTGGFGKCFQSWRTGWQKPAAGLSAAQSAVAVQVLQVDRVCQRSDHHHAGPGPPVRRTSRLDTPESLQDYTEPVL